MIDQLIEERYRIKELVGKGSSALVYKATDETDSFTVAIKLIRKAYMKEGFLETLFAEVEALTRLDHPNVVRLLSHGVHEERPFFVMEFVEGVSVHRFLKSAALSQLAIADIFLQVCSGIQMAHRLGIVHRDIKPLNIMFQPDYSVKILDFGLAIQVLDGRKAAKNRGVGTYDFMAPEQRRDPRSVDNRADIYGLGATLYQMCTRKPPVPLQIKKVPERFRQIVEACCEYEIEERTQDIEEVIEQVRLARKKILDAFQNQFPGSSPLDVS